MTTIFITGDRTEGARMVTPIALQMLKELAADPGVKFVTSTQTGVEQAVNLIGQECGLDIETVVTEGSTHAEPAAACDRILFYHVAPDESGWYPQLVAAAGEDKVELPLQAMMLEAMLGGE